MNDAIKAILGSQLRHWLLLLLGAGLSRHIVPQDVVDAIDKMSGLEVLAFLSAAGVMLWGLYRRLMDKTKIKIAQDLPKGASDAHVDAVAAKQTLAAIAKVKPKHVAVLIVGAAIALSVSCTNSAGMNGGNISVTGGVSGKVKTTDGKDMDYDLHGTWTQPTPAPGK